MSGVKLTTDGATYQANPRHLRAMKTVDVRRLVNFAAVPIGVRLDAMAELTRRALSTKTTGGE